MRARCSACRRTASRRRTPTPRRRTRLFAIYGLSGAIAASLGSLASGSPDLAAAIGWTRLEALRALFVLYALLGLAGAACYRLIPPDVEAATERPSFALGPSRGIVVKLAALFSIDAFAGGAESPKKCFDYLFGRYAIQERTAFVIQGAPLGAGTSPLVMLGLCWAEIEKPS